MKLSTNYTFHANIAHVNYCSNDESFNFYSDDDESIEIYGAKREDVIRLLRNYLLVHLVKETTKEQLSTGEQHALLEVKEALKAFLKEEGN